MNLIHLNPLEIWCFYPGGDLNIGYLMKLAQQEQKHPVPVFRVPEYQKPVNFKIGHKYILIDGNHRVAAARVQRSVVLAAVYEWGERIDVKAHNLKPFRHANDPNLYERLSKWYALRDKVQELQKRLEA